MVNVSVVRAHWMSTPESFLPGIKALRRQCVIVYLTLLKSDI